MPNFTPARTQWAVTISEDLDFGTWCRLGSCQCHSWHLVPQNVAEVLMPEIPSTGHEAETEALTSDELLVEEVSIDGMCGVY